MMALRGDAVHRTVATILFLSTLLVPAVVCAQGITVAPIVPGGSRAEIMGGLSFEAPADVNSAPLCVQLGMPCLTPRTMPDFGGMLSTVVHLDDHIAIVAEASASRNAWSGFGTACAPVGGSIPAQCPDARINLVRSALVGPRIRTGEGWGASLNPPMRVFAQVLAGLQWADVVPRRTCVQPGVGVELYLRNGVIVQAEVDYLWAPGSARNLSTARTAVGLAFPIGGV
jgi:hypothetical protein